MSIEFTTAFTKTPVVEFNWATDNLKSMFDDYQSWNSLANLKGMGYKGLAKRLCKSQDQIVDKPQAWTDLVSALTNSKLQLVEQMLKIDTEHRWPNIPVQISNQLSIYVSLISDLKGYNMNPHLDNRSVYAAGYLNVFDNEPLTVVGTHQPSFFRKRKVDSQYHAPGGQGRGAIWLNTDASWHWVKPALRDRRIIFFTFQLVSWN